MTDTVPLRIAIIEAAEYLERRGIMIDTSRIIKARDKREPGRKEKEKHERQVMLFFRAMFARQKRHITQRAAMLKKLIDYDDIMFDDDFDPTPEEIAALIRIYQQMALGGVSVFALTAGDIIDYTLVNKRALEAARKLALEMIKDITETTKEVIRSVIGMFVDTPGMTIMDMVNLLPFDEKRAMRIAVTETTRAYAIGQAEAGAELQAQFPETKVVKQWYTNNDDIVCDICGPLDGKQVGRDEPFDAGNDIFDPPAHPNCRCWSEYTTDISA